MNTFIALIRSINVAGNTVPMAVLKKLFDDLGHTNVQTYLQSGNVVFNSQNGDPAGLAAAIAAGIEKSTGLRLAVILRSHQELAAVFCNNPFITERKLDPASLYVTFLQSRPDEGAAASLAAPAGETDEFLLLGNEVFLNCPGGYGRTKLNNNYFEKKLKTAATTRNWKTVTALYEMSQGR